MVALPMMKMIVLVSRAQGMSPDDFHEYWREDHPKVLDATPADMPPMRKYVQSHTLPSVYESRDPTIDGVVEVWFDDARAVDEFFGHEYYEERIRPDEERFTNHEQTAFFVAQETAMDTTPVTEEMVKALVPLARRDGMTPNAFHRHWRHDHLDRIADTEPWNSSVEHYVQHHAINELEEADVAYDGLAELWFSTPQALDEHLDEWGETGIMGPESDRFIDTAQLTYFPTTHEVVI